MMNTGSGREAASLVDAVSSLPTVSVTFLVQPDGALHVISFSEGFCRMAGCTREEAEAFYVSSAARDAFSKEDRGLMEFYRLHCGDAVPVSYTCPMPLPHGGELWVSVQFSRFSAGSDRYVYVLFTDIDELKRHELDLEEQYRSAQTLMDSVTGNYMAMRRCNLTQNRVEMTRGAEILHSVQREENYDESIRVLLRYIPDAADRQLCAEYYSRASLTGRFESGIETVEREYRLCSEEGGVKWVRSVIHLTRQPGSGDLVAFSTVQDISGAVLREKLSDCIMQQYCETVAYCDLRIRRLHVQASKNAKALRLTDIDYDRAADIAAEQLAPGEADGYREKVRLDHILAALEKEPVYTFYCTFSERCGNLPGRPRRRVKNDVFYLDERHDILVFLLTDVTEIFEQNRENREQMAEALVAAKQASTAKSNFLSRMSHEIRTPLNAIIGMDTIAAQSVTKPEKVADCVAKIGLSARYLLSLINDILDMSRIESGKMLLKNDGFLFAEFIAGVNNIIFPQARARKLDYECTVASDVEDSYVGDEMKLQQILVNVLGNAVKFTAKGKVSLDVSVQSRDENRDKLRFVVNDTGCGIAEENIPRIFDAFEQVDTTTTTVFGGTGLGLAITKNLVGLMGGSITVRSIVGVGSEFTIDVPLQIDKAVVRPPKLPSALRNLHTLIVDDDLFICEQTQAILKDIGMVGEWVTSGQEAVGRVRAKSSGGTYYDFILIDWKMPDMDGIETTQRIRSIVGPEVTIIIISAYDWQSIEAEARAAGANLMISKPLLKSTLISAFEEALGQSAEKKTPAPHFDFAGRRILVAEDNELNAEIARTLLEDRHFSVDIASNGLKVLEKFAGSPAGYYDAILMDVRMPMMDGLQATVNIRHWDKADARSIPIVAMTANAFDEDVEKSRSAGMNAHLSKPIDPDLLFSTLYRLLEKES